MQESLPLEDEKYPILQFKQAVIESCPYNGLYVLWCMKIINKSIESNGIYSSQIKEIYQS